MICTVGLGYIGLPTALMLAVPAGNMPLMLSKQLQIDTDTISQGIILTTLLGLVTIPVVSMIL